MSSPPAVVTPFDPLSNESVRFVVSSARARDRGNECAGSERPANRSLCAPEGFE